MPKLGEIDKDGSRAYELSCASDNALKAGDVTRARDLMVEAAVLDGRYGVRAEFVGQSDKRAVRVSPTMRKLLIAPLLEGGFRCNQGTSWTRGTFLERVVADVTHTLVPGVDKFGGAICILAIRTVGGKIASFDWGASSLRSAALNYRTQAELEAVCLRWNAVLREEVPPWLEAGSR